MSNMEIWNQCKTPPNEAVKKITGGRLKGLNDIKPQWRIQKLTEMFGACGDGWNYEIVNIWNVNGDQGQLFVFAQINLNIKDFPPIPGVGGDMLIKRERDGLYHNDEAVKMAITDAIGVACKMIGIGADVYMGVFDTKYLNQQTQPPKQTDKPQVQEPQGQQQLCPKCNSEMWDNREKKKQGQFKDTAPDFKCKDLKCDGVIWPPKDNEPPLPEEPPY